MTRKEKGGGLNEPQRRAVAHREGPLLILAGAGAGKTRTIAERVKALIEDGVEPERILAITFTNKAASEMRERIEGLLAGTGARGLPFVSTFHALGGRLLRENARTLGLTRHFPIYDRSDSLRVVKEALKEAGYDGKEIEPKRILHALSRAKGEGMTQSEYAAAAETYGTRVIAEVWERYERKLWKERALDFDDLLVKTLKLLREREDVRRACEERWHYLHIDEYQDTNRVQYELARILAGERKNLCVVGDIDQNIYSWRGADLRNILHFERDFSPATVVALTENYRSTRTIVEASNQVISKNRARIEKTAETKNAAGEKISLYAAQDEADEASFAASKARELILNGTKPSSIAVLYRANFQSRILEEKFLAAGVPYRVIGTKFFERKEVKDVLAFIRAALADEELAHIKRIINIPPRGIGKVSFLKIAAGKEAELPKGTREKFKEFRTLLSSIKKAAHSRPVSETIRFIIEASGMGLWLAEGGEEERERLQNIRELVTIATGYDGETPEEGMLRFLTDAAIATEQDELDEKAEAVPLMTVHAAKGLEFEYVFVAGLEEGLFPFKGFGDERDEEEERRLFYVALTRARKKVFLTCAALRTLYGARQMNTPSSFLSEIDSALTEIETGDTVIC